MHLNELINIIDGFQTIEVCRGFDETKPYPTPKTLFYGKALEIYGTSFWDVNWMSRIKSVSSYSKKIELDGVERLFENSLKTIIFIDLE